MDIVSLLMFVSLICFFTVIILYIRKIFNDKIKGRKKLEELRRDRPDEQTILISMYKIAENTIKLADRYFENYKLSKSNPIVGLLLIAQQVKLENKMNRYIVAEWIPRITYLNEQQKNLRMNSILYDAFKEFENIDEDIRNLKLSKLTSVALYNSFKSGINIVLTGVAIGGLLALAGVSILNSSIKNAGKDIGTGGGYRYDPYTGERLP